MFTIYYMSLWGKTEYTIFQLNSIVMICCNRDQKSHSTSAIREKNKVEMGWTDKINGLQGHPNVL